MKLREKLFIVDQERHWQTLMYIFSKAGLSVFCEFPWDSEVVPASFPSPVFDWLPFPFHQFLLFSYSVVDQKVTFTSLPW